MSLKKAVFVLILGFLMIAPAQVFAGYSGPLGTRPPMVAELPNGVYCEINKVSLFALSAEDCVKASGVVTHTVTTTVKPAETDKE